MTTITSRAHGLDVSKYDVFFKPELITGQLDFVIQRISYGVTRDEAFFMLLPGVMTVPIHGGYHYLSSQKTWREQADAYLSFVAGYDYHFHCCDFEGAFNMLSVDFAHQAWQWIQYVQAKTGRETLIYTSLSLYNQYIAPSSAKYNINWNVVPLWQAQWLFTPDPNRNPISPIERAAGWNLFQYTNKGDGPAYGVARTGECDLDVYNGTPAQMREWLNIDEGTPPADVISQPFNGIQRISGIRNGWEFELFISDPAKVRYESVCCSPLETVSSVAKHKGATLAVNGGDWYRNTGKLKDYTVSNGQVCVERTSAAPPTLMIDKSNRVVIDYKPIPDVVQAISGVHWLIQNGMINPELYRTDKADFTEGHARFVFAETVDGKLILFSSEGIHPTVTEFDGMLLSEAAEIVKQYGGIKASDGGGGGDVICILDGKSLLQTENINPATGEHFDRPLPQVFLIYANGGSTMTQYKVVWPDGVRKRTAPTTSAGPVGNVIPVNTIVDVVQDDIPDQTYPADVTKKWVKFSDGSYGASQYETVRMQLYSLPPPPLPVPASLHVVMDQKDENGNIIATYEGDLAKK